MKLWRLVSVWVVLVVAISCSSGSGEEDAADVAGGETASEDTVVDLVPDGADLDPEVLPDAIEPDTTTDAVEPDTDLVIPPDDAVIEAPITPGAFLITEFMADPDASGSAYEWLEIYNSTDEWLTLTGCLLRDDGGEESQIGGDAKVAPKSYVVVAYEGTASSWFGSGVVIAAYYKGMTLDNTGDEIILDCRGTTIDRVYYGPGHVKRLVARQLKPESFNYVTNDDPDQWCDAEEPFGDGSVMGTPGGANSLCTQFNPCEPNPCINPPQPACDSQNAVLLSFEAPGTCRLVGEQFTCDYTPKVDDCFGKGQICENAQCVKVENPCDPDPCVEPPADFCQPDLKTLVHYSGPGVCTVVGGAPSCSFDSWNEDCGTYGQECKGAKCVDIIVDAKPTDVGDVIVSEYMARSGPDPDYGEWIELYNTTNVALNLKTCELVDMSGQKHTFFANVVIQPQDYLLLARSDDPLKNHGLVPDYVYSGFLLNNSAGYIIIKCGLKKIDEVYYQSSLVEEGKSTQLDVAKLDYVENDKATSWCKSGMPFGTAGKFGTPGSANVECALQINPVDWCRLISPLETKLILGSPVLFAGVIQEEGITTITPWTDAQGPIRAQAGYGPKGTLPEGNEQWTWSDATGSPTWNGYSMDIPLADEYTVILYPGLGYYSTAFRFSADSGTTWTYCDQDRGEGQDGSEDGFSIEDAGIMYIVETMDPCVPNPCVEPPQGSCEEGDKWAIYFVTPGICTSETMDSPPQCNYSTAAQNCHATGQVCLNGECVDPE